MAFNKPQHIELPFKNPSEKLLKSLTCAVLIHHGNRLPFVENDNVQNSPAYGGVLRVEVNVKIVFIVHRRVFPAGLDVWHLQGIANGLDGADRGAMSGPEDRCYPQGQLVTY